MFDWSSPMMGLLERMNGDSRRCLGSAQRIAAASNLREIHSEHMISAIHEVKPDIVGANEFAKGNFPVSPKLEDFVQTIERTRESSSGEEIGFDLRFSTGLEQAAALAMKTAQRFGSSTVAPVHLLWGILHAEPKVREQLATIGVTGNSVEHFCEQYRKDDPWRSRVAYSGIGYDLHRLAEGRKLMIGGIEVPFDKGSVGHSDGDVLAHALCDALLGAAGLGDIGTHFPDTDPKWKGASSLLFLEHTRKLLDQKRLRIAHLDAVVICERPKLGPHFPAMRAALAKSLGIDQEKINLKAKTNEGTGEIGRGEAIAAHTIATLEG
jgi:2-C-methyl-D-erythritol 2,4-cyclodiphosphate synthase